MKILRVELILLSFVIAHCCTAPVSVPTSTFDVLHSSNIQSINSIVHHIIMALVLTKCNLIFHYANRYKKLRT